jgi:hypothetical protein
LGSDWWAVQFGSSSIIKKKTNTFFPSNLQVNYNAMHKLFFWVLGDFNPREYRTQTAQVSGSEMKAQKVKGILKLKLVWEVDQRMRKRERKWPGTAAHGWIIGIFWEGGGHDWREFCVLGKLGYLQNLQSNAIK